MDVPARHARNHLLSARTTLILAIACAIGGAAGVLAYLASRSVPQAVLTAGTATSGAAAFLRELAGSDPRTSASAEGGKQDGRKTGE